MTWGDRRENTSSNSRMPRKALRVNLCPAGFLFVHVVMNTFLCINRCFVVVLGPAAAKGKFNHLLMRQVVRRGMNYEIPNHKEETS